MKTTVAAIDFGTSKIVTLVAENSGSRRCDIVGAGIAPYDGFLEDGWNNPEAVNDAIEASIKEAQSTTRKKIQEINVGVPGAFTRVYETVVQIDLNGTRARVKPEHIKKLFQKAHDEVSIMGIVIHSSPAWFMVDDGKKTLEPVGLEGKSIKAMISFVIANQFFIDDVSNRLQELQISVNGFYSTATGEAMLYLPEEDRDHTAALIDIGYLNTEVMIVEGDAMIYHHNIDNGGGYIAADLAQGLDISLSSAEQIKRQYVYGITTVNTTYEVASPDGQKPLSFEREKVAEIVEARVDEIAEEIKAVIDDSGVNLGEWSNVYLTGGGLAFNRGGREYLAGKLGLPVRDIPKRTAKLNSHAYSSSLGLMNLIIDTMQQQEDSKSPVLKFIKSKLFGIMDY
ncbi:MAG: cell division FtsA domain-containing protein [Clostridia bacterium]|nr:cell division FtsA domain-containing protein [Clostridia bacterium]